MEKFLLVFLGGGLGAMGRYGLGSLIGRVGISSWPHATLAANVAGGLAMGVLAAWLAHRGGTDQERWRLLLGVGLLGGFTTFSAFSLETGLMIERREFGAAALYILLSTALSIGALFAGMALVRRVLA